MQQAFSVVTVLLSALDLNPKCSVNQPVMLLYFTPESLAVAMFYFFFAA